MILTKQVSFGATIYRWKRMEETGYAWWKDRLRHLSTTVDLIRIDHFEVSKPIEVPARNSSRKWKVGKRAGFKILRQ